MKTIKVQANVEAEIADFHHCSVMCKYRHTELSGREVCALFMKGLHNPQGSRTEVLRCEECHNAQVYDK